jgi:hypothetical protein
MTMPRFSGDRSLYRTLASAAGTAGIEILPATQAQLRGTLLPRPCPPGFQCCDPPKCYNCGSQEHNVCCVDGSCVSGQVCLCGGCGDPTGCSLDRPTAAVVETAKATIAAGAPGLLVVPLSPGGCYCYQAERAVDGTLVGEQFLFAGRPILMFQHTANTSIGLQDEDGDGIPEWSTQATRAHFSQPREGNRTTGRARLARALTDYRLHRAP